MFYLASNDGWMHDYWPRHVIWTKYEDEIDREWEKERKNSTATKPSSAIFFFTIRLHFIHILAKFKRASEINSKADKWINSIERDIYRNYIDMKKRFVCGFFFLLFVVFDSEAMQSNIEWKHPSQKRNKVIINSEYKFILKYAKKSINSMLREGSDGVRWPYTEFELIFAILLHESHNSIHWNFFTICLLLLLMMLFCFYR